MSKTISLLSALLCTFIWGTTFIAQDTGMDNIGPFTFNAVRFFIGFLAITPLVLLFEIKKFKSEFKSQNKTFVNLSFLPLISSKVENSHISFIQRQSKQLVTKVEPQLRTAFEDQSDDAVISHPGR